jgi:hypothetical protein
MPPSSNADKSPLLLPGVAKEPHPLLYIFFKPGALCETTLLLHPSSPSLPIYKENGGKPHQVSKQRVVQRRRLAIRTQALEYCMIPVASPDQFGSLPIDRNNY